MKGKELNPDASIEEFSRLKKALLSLALSAGHAKLVMVWWVNRPRAPERDLIIISA
jgi:hypothetical protein